jgi:hypothetical protein
MYLKALFTIILFSCELLAQGKDVTSEYFGLKGDGVTDNTNAFKKLSIWVKGNPNSSVTFSKGLYLVKGTSFSKNGNLDLLVPVIDLTQCYNIKLEGNGSIIKYMGGRKFGAFDPLTGNKADKALPFYDRRYISELGDLILIRESKNISLKGFKLDGNIAKMIIGGKWGDRDYQVSHRGINIYNSCIINLSKIEIENFGLDGIGIHNNNYRTDKFSNKIVLDSIVSTYNGRQGLSWTGGNGLIIKNSIFSHTGEGTIKSSPGAGLDIEPEGGSYCDNAIVINSIFEYNTGAGFVTDLGDMTSDISFENCIFTSPNQFVVWPNGSNIMFNSCIFNGALIPAGKNSKLPVRYLKCIINDLANAKTTGVPSGYLVEGGGGQKNYIFDSCTFNIKYRKFAFVEPYAKQKSFSPKFTNNKIIINENYRLELPFAVIRRSLFKGNSFIRAGRKYSPDQVKIVFEDLID